MTQPREVNNPFLREINMTLRYYLEPNGDYLCIDPDDSNHRMYPHFGKEVFSGRAAAISGSPMSVSTTTISRSFLKDCERVKKRSVPKIWMDRFYPEG